MDVPEIPSRRSLLRTGGVVAALAVAGCRTEDGAAGETASDSTPTGQTNRLRATTVRPEAVDTGSTVAVLTPKLLELVQRATEADGRVDFDESIEAARRDVPLPLGGFEFVQFAGETYEASSATPGFAAEASYNYHLESVSPSAADGDVVRYRDLTDAERRVADRLIDGEGYFVGFHEAKPAAVQPFDEHDVLRTDAGTYRIVVVVGDSAPHRTLTLEQTTPGTGTQVVTVADQSVPETVRSTVRRAVANGAVDFPDGERTTLASFFDGIGHVATATAVAEIEIGDGDG